MHELAVTQEIVRAVLEGSAGARVTRVRVEVGKLSCVLPEALQFCFELCVEGTRAEGAELEISRPPGLARCRACSLEIELDGPVGLCSCGSCDLEWLSGEQLLVRDMEVVECAPPADAPTQRA